MSGKPAGNWQPTISWRDRYFLRSGGRLRINAQLVRTRDDAPGLVRQVQAAPCIRRLGLIQDEISRTIVNNLRVKPGPWPPSL